MSSGEVVMPRLSDSMEEGTIIAWLKSPGDEVAVGEELVEIETDKATMVYESDLAGTFSEILVEEGGTAAVGEPIARFGEESGAEGGDSATAEDLDGAGPETGTAAASAPAAELEGSSNAAGVSGSDAPKDVKASPLARRFAAAHGVDVFQAEGSGPRGRILKADVRRVVEEGHGAGTGGLSTSTQQVEVESPPVPTGGGGDGGEGRAAPAPAGGQGEGQTAKGTVETQEPSKLQQVVARRMSEAKATAPHFYLTTEVEMTRAFEARAALKAAAKEGDVVPSFNDMVVKACAMALTEHPKANSAYRDGKFELYSRVNVGIAVAAPGALVVPTVFDADQKGLRRIASDSRELAAKVRDGKITPPELSGATFTVSNLGMYGITEFGAVINLPQAAILAVGAITEQPRFDSDGEVREAKLMKATLSCDHRVLYGAEGAQLLARVRELLEEPLSLAL